ncbi:acyl dehydratase [Streptomyces sp. SAI-135]|uniref:MaoC/PaaZ C-terminal domain-containing protein n=1 Tax=unclassified Streptomyces TaxID=2593676 RepID=UPI0024770284|nr:MULTISPECIES: MaoC/PaaZ C-terminal domain-containing protein [unclassified Streptomyces]MDH6521934.1 acyl dehydratase [Streptomyces sp. SAI-090]MDH6573303.1 acyl dehydratase [Streptomyces sp. SAI-117]MDH6613964.1 acyl dehydratase [Streptomyces sp. SAI-135]
MTATRNEPTTVTAPLTRTLPPVTRTDLALYAGASGDHNPVHIDIDAARRAGLDDVIAHGMLSMAWAGRVLEEVAGPGSVRTYRMRFTAPVRVGDRLSVTVRPAGEDVEVQVVDSEGAVKARGTARLGPAVPGTERSRDR